MAGPPLHDGANPPVRPYPGPRPELVPCDPARAAEGRALRIAIAIPSRRELPTLPALAVAVIKGKASATATTLAPPLLPAATSSGPAREAGALRAGVIRAGHQAIRQATFRASPLPFARFQAYDERAKRAVAAPRRRIIPVPPGAAAHERPSIRAGLTGAASLALARVLITKGRATTSVPQAAVVANQAPLLPQLAGPLTLLHSLSFFLFTNARRAHYGTRSAPGISTLAPKWLFERRYKLLRLLFWERR